MHSVGLGFSPQHHKTEKDYLGFQIATLVHSVSMTFLCWEHGDGIVT